MTLFTKPCLGIDRKTALSLLCFHVADLRFYSFLSSAWKLFRNLDRLIL